MKSMRTRMRFPMHALPTSITLGNAVCGFAAITFVMQAESGSAAYGPLSIAGIFIIVAMALDAIDGGVARLTGQTSDFGAELDSLCDLVSFGIAPAMMMLKFSQGIPTRLLWFISLLFVLCALVRLARFNCEDHETDEGHGWFVGLPSPAAAGMIASLLIAWPGLLQLADAASVPRLQSTATWLTNVVPTGLPWLTLLLACLMVSRIRYPHSVEQFRQGKRVVIHLAFSYLAILAFSYVHELALPLLFFTYVLGGPLRAFAWLTSPLITRQPRPVLR